MASELNLIRLKKLLEEGFVIEEIIYHWEKKALTITVNLIKGSVREKIASVNEADFFDYIRHFEKVADGYGNMVFMFIEDREEFEKRMKEVPKYKPLRNSHYIKVGERLLEKDVTITLLQKPGPSVRLARAHFFVNMSSNPEFQKLDLKDQVEIYSKDKDELVYRGYVQYLGFGKDVAYFECELGPRTFRVEKLTVEFIGFRSVDTLYFVTRASGLTFVPAPEMKINLSPRDFVVITPIRDLIIKDLFRFGNVEFYPVFDTKDDLIIRKSKMARREPDWGSNFPRARIVVKASSHFDAIEIGYLKIKDALNWFTFRNDLTFPVIDDLGEKSIVRFNYFKYYSRVRLSPMVYCREIETEHACLFDTRELLGNVLSIEYDPKEYFKPTKRLFEPIMTKTRSNLVQEEKNILLSLHWLARSIHQGNNVDKLLDLWTSLEFVISRTKVRKLFTKNLKKLIVKKIRELDLQQEQISVLKDKIAMLNDAPLMEKMRSFATQHLIDFTYSEWDLFRRMRVKRNDIIHGKREIDLSDDEIEKLRGMIERILIEKTNETVKALVPVQS